MRNAERYRDLWQLFHSSRFYLHCLLHSFVQYMRFHAHSKGRKRKIGSPFQWEMWGKKLIKWLNSSKPSFRLWAPLSQIKETHSYRKYAQKKNILPRELSHSTQFIFRWKKWKEKFVLIHSNRSIYDIHTKRQDTTTHITYHKETTHSKHVTCHSYSTKISNHFSFYRFVGIAS